MVSIVNIVGSGDLGIELDPEAIEDDLTVPYTEYDPLNYHGLYVRVAEDGPLITIYQSGKYIISGCSDFEELNRTNREFLQIMSDLGVFRETIDTGFTVQNVVCTGDLYQSVNLNALSIGLGLESVEYEPEQFPRLVYRPSEHPAVLLVFANGKVVVTGAANIETADDAFEYLRSQVDTVLEN